MMQPYQQHPRPLDQEATTSARLTALVEALLDRLEDAHNHLELAETSVAVEWTRDTLTECRIRVSDAITAAHSTLEALARPSPEPGSSKRSDNES